MPEQLLTTAEVAVELRMSENGVMRLARIGKLKNVKVGHRSVRYPRSAVDAFLAANTRGK